MSFLAYFLRAYPDSLIEYRDRIPDFVIRLLQDCPPEASATRKVKNLNSKRVSNISREYNNLMFTGFSR